MKQFITSGVREYYLFLMESDRSWSRGAVKNEACVERKCGCVYSVWVSMKYMIDWWVLD